MRILFFLFLLFLIFLLQDSPLFALENFPDQTPFLPIQATQNSSNSLTIKTPGISTTPVISASNLNPNYLNPNYLNPDNLNLNNKISLQSAIYLALRHNTDLLTSLNNRQLERFDLLTAQQAFEPQASITNSLNYSKTESTGSPNYFTKSASVGPQVTWTLPLGTQVQTSVNYQPSGQSGTSGELENNNYESSQLGYSITVTQPLLQGFGVDVNEVDLDNAYDQQTIDDLNLETTVETTVINVANAYYAVVSAEQAYQISERSLQDAQKELARRKARLEAGQIPATDVTQASIDLMTQQQSLGAADQALSSAKADFLNTLGLPSNTSFEVDPNPTISQEPTDLIQSDQEALKNNINLKVEALESKQDERNILKSKDSRKWTLDLVASRSRSSSSTTYEDINNPNTSNTSDNSSISLNLTIPLNQVTLDQNELSSAISLENQQITEAQQKRSLINNVNAAVNNLNSQWFQYQMAQEKLTLSQQSFNAARIEYQYGKLDAFAFQQQQESYINSQQSVVDSEINYLKQVMSYQQLVGTLLTHWHINIEAPAHV